MSERRSWTEEEDKALKYLKDTLQVKKWSEISRRLEFQFNLPGRNGKQCRQRYTNHLDSSIINKQFLSEDEEKLFKLHDKIGNKWSLISKQFIGRTDNQIKNHFHSKLRKGIRKLNKEIKQHYKKTIKPFKLSVIYKIVEASDYRFTEKILLNQQTLSSFNQLKNFLLQYAGAVVEKSQLSTLKPKDQTLFLTTKLETFEKFMKNLKTGLNGGKKSKVQFKHKVEQKQAQNESTSGSENSSEKEHEMQIEDIDSSCIFDDDESFQFMVPVNHGYMNYKSIGEKTLASLQEGEQEKNMNSVSEKTQGIKIFYSFSNDKNQTDDSNHSQRNIFFSIPNGLIEEVELPSIRMSKKFSVNSFDSLKEFDDCLNESEIGLMIRKFDSYSDIEAGLFQ